MCNENPEDLGAVALEGELGHDLKSLTSTPAGARVRRGDFVGHGLS